MKDTDTDGVFVDVDEEDSIVGLQLRVITDDGDAFIAGGLVPEPGRYVLKKAEQSEHWEWIEKFRDGEYTVVNLEERSARDSE